jgi:aromatic ring-cleaving dioxygenase
MKIEWTRTVVPERDAAGRLRRHAEHEAPVDVQDGGQAQIVEFFGYNMEGLFVRVQSWDPDKEHANMALMMGKRVRVTVQILED